MSASRYARAIVTGAQARTAPEKGSACAQEAIATPQAIQPHGVLFVISENTNHVTHASSNTQAHLGHPAQAMLGTPLVNWVYKQDQERFTRMLATRPAPDYNPFKLRFWVNDELTTFDAILHRYGGLQFLELERTATLESRAFVSFFQETREALHRLRASHDLMALCATTAEKVRSMTGFDRVMIYKFDEHWDGQVVAESCAPGARRFFNYHFPEGDIPAQARQMYLTSRMRAIPDVNYESVPIVAAPGQPDGPLDLTMSVLRSVSPMHRQYSQAMGLQATFSISLIRDDKLWGLMICGHEACKLYASYEVRTTCEFLCEVMTSLIGSKEAVTDKVQRDRLKEVNKKLLDQMFDEQDVARGLIAHAVNMTHACGAQGAALCRADTVHCVGITPEKDFIVNLTRWLSDQDAQAIFATDSLAALWPAARNHSDVACGILAAPLSGAQQSYLIWFRPDNREVRTWGGTLDNEGGPGGHQGLNPRTFDAHKTIQIKRSAPWHPTECEAARDLSRAVVDLALQHSDMLQHLNDELARSNAELNAFAYAASHDLKEPLRGIQHFSGLIIDELGSEHLVGQSQYRLNAVQGMASRMGQLIDALLRYAHVGRAELNPSTVCLQDVLTQVSEPLQSRLLESHAELIIAPNLPQVSGDAILLAEVFSNLIANAVKYNRSAHPRVEVGFTISQKTGQAEVFVADNGIGIEAKHSDAIFLIFRRLHGRHQYGGGSGAGLTISKRIVERHGSMLTFDSNVGVGTTFRFALPLATAHQSE